MDVRALTPAQVDVWLVRPQPACEGEGERRMQALLPATELAELAAFDRARTRSERLVARALRRAALSRYAPVGPSHWRFETEAAGRPRLAAGQCALDLRFSVSHTRGLVACAVTLGHDVGIDVEHASAIASPLELAERFFSPEEARDIRERSVGERLPRFLRYWTLKEAALKARGEGITTSLHTCAFRLPDDDDRSDKSDDKNCLAVAVGGGGDDCRYWQWHPTADHTLCVALRRRIADGPVELRVVESAPFP